jgi:hypothetical protein
MKKTPEIVISFIGFFLVIWLLILSAAKTKDNTMLFKQITDINSEISVYETNIILQQNQLEKESGFVTINNYAEEVLKLKPLVTEQIVYIEVPVDYEVDEVPKLSWLQRRFDDFQRILDLLQS